MCPIDIAHDGKLAARVQFLFDVVVPAPEYIKPHRAFNSAQTICDALNLARLIQISFTPIPIICVSFLMANGPMGVMRA
jgi:hypothetical protein